MTPKWLVEPSCSRSNTVGVGIFTSIGLSETWVKRWQKPRFLWTHEKKCLLSNFPPSLRSLPIQKCIRCVLAIPWAHAEWTGWYFCDTKILILARVLCSRSPRAEYNEFGLCGSTRAEYNGFWVSGSTWPEFGAVLESRFLVAEVDFVWWHFNFLANKHKMLSASRG